MKLGRFQQTPLEEKAYLVDYSQWLGSTETVVSVSVTIGTVTTPPLIVNQVATAPDGKSVSFYVSGGESGTTYEIQLIATTSIGQIKNDQIFYTVKTL